MPLNVRDVFARARAAAEQTQPEAFDYLHRIVHETIAACGLEVNQATGEVYNPAEGVPQTQVATRRRGSIRNYQRVR
jgi:hypothetical protein